MDPNLVENTRNQMEAKKQSLASYDSKVDMLSNQIRIHIIFFYLRDK